MSARVTDPDPTPHVIIIGGGFAGLSAARKLGRARVRVTLVDRRNHHLFQPLLYQVATAGLSGPDIAAPIRNVLKRQWNTTVLLGEVRAIDVERSVVNIDGGELSYDWLIVAAGATNSYFGHEEWQAHAPGLKTLEDALQVRKRVLLAYEAAEREPDERRRKTWLTFVIVGGGPTGVELAGALAEIAQHTLARNFRNFDPSNTRIVLLDRATLLASMPAKLQAAAERSLLERGVEVRLGHNVEHIAEDHVIVGGERIETRTVLWAAGVKPSALAEQLGVALERGRVPVKPDLSLAEHPEVFAVGDLMALRQDGQWLPGLAQVALQSGRHAAANILRRIEGEPVEPFRYRDKGELATIGRSAAVCRIGSFTFSGFPAWIVWWAVHLFFLIGFRNRIMVMSEWIWAYLTWNRSARVIMEGSEAARLPPVGQSGPLMLQATSTAGDKAAARTAASRTADSSPTRSQPA
jgi:NADH dehydrogenase